MRDLTRNEAIELSYMLDQIPRDARFRFYGSDKTGTPFWLEVRRRFNTLSELEKIVLQIEHLNTEKGKI